MPFTITPVYPQAHWRRRSGVKGRAYFSHTVLVLLQGTEAKAETFYLHIDALLPNRLLIAVWPFHPVLI